MKKILILGLALAALVLINPDPASTQAPDCEGTPNASTWISCNLACETIAEVCCPGECRDTRAEWFSANGIGICYCATWCEQGTCSGSGGGGGGTSGDECDSDEECSDPLGPGWYCVAPETSYSWCELEYHPQ